MNTRLLVKASALATGALAAVALAVTAQGESEGPTSVAGTSATPATLDALRSAPTVSTENDVHYKNSDTARRAAIDIGRDIPLPTGGNFDGIHWSTVDDGIGIWASEVQELLEANASCQWYRAFSEGRDPKVASTVVQAIPQWPALRRAMIQESASKIAKEVASDSSDRPELASKTAECDRVHKDEIGAAQARGLTPPR